MGHIIDQFNAFLEKCMSYFNPFGELYIKIIILCRVLVVEVFLDDLFEFDDDNYLSCETDQVGCEISCINRFMPINHLQLWQFELFCAMMATCVFLAVNLINNHVYQKRKKKDKSLSMFVEKEGVVHSKLTAVGYITMLVVRLTLELWCVFLEMNLAKHHSQNSKFSEKFWLKDHWLCPTYSTNIGKNAVAESIDAIIPHANRSELFYRTDTVVACEQQQTTVTCWIPMSRMKRYGMLFMFGVLIMQTALTFCELSVEFIKPCVGLNKGFGPKRNKNDPLYHVESHVGGWKKSTSNIIYATYSSEVSLPRNLAFKQHSPCIRC